MIKLEHNSTNKGFIVEEINDKINKELIAQGKVEPLKADKVENNPESVEKHIELAKKDAEKKVAEIEKVAITTKGEDKVVFAESMKFKTREELANFITKLKEDKQRRRIIRIHEDADGFAYEVKYERPLTVITEEVKDVFVTAKTLEEFANLKVGDKLQITEEAINVFKEALDYKTKLTEATAKVEETKTVEDVTDKDVDVEPVIENKTTEVEEEKHISEEWNFEEEDRLADEEIKKEMVEEDYSKFACDDEIDIKVEEVKTEDTKTEINESLKDTMWDFGDEE